MGVSTLHSHDPVMLTAFSVIMNALPWLIALGRTGLEEPVLEAFSQEKYA
jgi:hypothetical protein